MNDSVVVSQLGARMHYAVPRILHEAGRLECLYTDLCAVKGWPRALALLPGTALPASLRRLAGRVPPGIPAKRIRTFGAFGITSGMRRTFGKPENETDTALTVARGFSAAVVNAGFGQASGFYGIGGECLEQLRAARARGLWTAVEQIVAPREMLYRLIASEHERHPGWEASPLRDTGASEFAAREKAEWELASLVVCPSTFVRDGIAQAGGPAERCAIVPYGVDSQRFAIEREPSRAGPLRVLFVGQVGLRKGAPYVLEAARRLAGLAAFTMVGSIAVTERRRRELAGALDITGPIPRAAILDQYRRADIFFLPTVCEGSATVTYEALAAGLPVVTTPNAGSVVRHAVDGFVCAAGDIDGSCAAIETLARDRERLAAMSAAARETGRNHDIASYGRRLMEALEPLRPAQPSSTRPELAA